MASTTDRDYTDPNFNTRREACQGVAGGGATTTYARYLGFQAIKLKAAHASVVVAGTTAVHKFDLMNGTTSIGSFALGTATAGLTTSIQGLNQTVPSLGVLSVRSGTDVTGTALVTYEFDIDPSAAQSV